MFKIGTLTCVANSGHAMLGWAAIISRLTKLEVPDMPFASVENRLPICIIELFFDKF
jgi:hypothetical protein